MQNWKKLFLPNKDKDSKLTGSNVAEAFTSSFAYTGLTFGKSLPEAINHDKNLNNVSDLSNTGQATMLGALSVGAIITGFFA